MTVSKSKQGKNKSSGKDAKDDILRPRTAYNFFYRYQRDLILKAKALSKTSTNGEVNLAHKMPDPFTWCVNDSTRRKRPHRKTHGLIGLQQLTKTVAKRWKEAGADTKNKFIALASQDKIRYKNETLRRPHHWIQPFDAASHQPRMPRHHHYHQYPHYYRGNKNCYPMAVHSAPNVTQYPYENGGLKRDCVTFEPMDFKKRAEYIPYQTVSNPSVASYHSEPPTHTSGGVLSAEEYDMLELLIKE